MGMWKRHSKIKNTLLSKDTWSYPMLSTKGHLNKSNILNMSCYSLLRCINLFHCTNDLEYVCLQLSSVRKVLDANLPSVSEYRSFEDHAPQDPTSLKPHHQDHTPATPPPVGTAVSFKMLITGKTVTACLLDPRKPDGGDSLSGAPQEDLLGTVSPLLVLGLYNPLCTFQWEGGVKRGDASLFSVAVGYNKDLAPVCE